METASSELMSVMIKNERRNRLIFIISAKIITSIPLTALLYA